MMATTLTEVPATKTISHFEANTVAQALLAEFEIQAPITRKFLERLPDEKLTWKPHEKSMTAGQLAYHLASIPGGIVRFAETSPAQTKGFNFPQPATRDEVLQVFDDSIATVRGMLPKYHDAAMKETWRLLHEGHEVFAVPRGQFLRDVMLNHWYQHRGQFSVYLRILNIPVPASFGPSADEPLPLMQKGN
jgi:uncharacterized damage-inducible protein DinB